MPEWMFSRAGVLHEEVSEATPSIIAVIEQSWAGQGRVYSFSVSVVDVV